MCVSCERGKDKVSHFIEECEITRNWFKNLEKNKEEKLNRIWNDED